MFKDILYDIRKKKKLSRNELSNLMSISPDTIRRWETGEREPRLSEIEKIANILGVSTDYLIKGVEPVGDNPAPAPAAIDNSGIIGDNNISHSTVNSVPPPRPAAPDVLLYIGPDGARVELPNTPENARVFRRMVAALLNSAEE